MSTSDLSLMRHPRRRSVALARTLIHWIDRRFELAMQYDALAELDEERLSDIGLTPADVSRVRAGRFW